MIEEKSGHYQQSQRRTVVIDTVYTSQKGRWCTNTVAMLTPTGTTSPVIILQVLEMSARLCAHRVASPWTSHKMACFVESGQKLILNMVQLCIPVSTFDFQDAVSARTLLSSEKTLTSCTIYTNTATAAFALYPYSDKHCVTEVRQEPGA